MARSIAVTVIAIGAALHGCASIAGFEDLRSDCPPGEPLCADAGAGASGPGGSAGKGGASGSGAGGGFQGCESAGQPPGLQGGPEMAKFVRPDGSCFWIDVTEVTEEQYADYLATAPGPSGDPRCPGEAERSDACRAARLDAGSPGEYPQTCVDWCEARAFCLWAGKDLCLDDAEAVDEALLAASDYYYACSAGGTHLASAPCPTEVCNVPQAGFDAIQPAGKASNCYVEGSDKTRVYDLIGNVAEWTAECLLDTPDGACLVRGGSFDASACCDEPSRVMRRRATTNTGFRCCYYAP